MYFTFINKTVHGGNSILNIINYLVNKISNCDEKRGGETMGVDLMSCEISFSLKLDLPNFYNGIIHLPFLELSIIILRISR